MIEAGRDDLTNELRREGLPMKRVWKSPQLKTVITELSYVDLDAMLAAIGEHHVSAKSVAQRIGKGFRSGDEDLQLPATVDAPRREQTEGQPLKVGVHVEGLDDLLVRLAQCCTPMPGDEIIGFVTRGRGVSVHRNDCANAASLMTEQATRMIDVEWDGSAQSDATYVTVVEVVALDRARLLRDVANALVDHHVNILSSQTITSPDRVAKMRFEFEFANPGYVDAVLRTIKSIDSVYDAYRLLPGAGATVPDRIVRLAGRPSPVAWSAVPTFQTSPGMRDLVPPDSARGRRFVNVFAEVVESAGYGQLSTPLIEDLGVFARIGDATEIVTKEMYDFVDKGRTSRRASARVHRQRRPRVRRASPDDAVEGLAGRSELPVREATAWSLPSVRSGRTSRCSASTTRISTSRSSPSAGSSIAGSGSGRSGWSSTASVSPPTGRGTSRRFGSTSPRSASR